MQKNDHDMCAKKRIEWIDTLKGIAIFLVVFGHYLTRLGCGNYLNKIIYSFHMPLFFFLSGFNFKGMEEKFIRYNFKRLMYPYFRFCCLMFIFMLVQYTYSGRLLDFLIEVFSIPNVFNTLGMSYMSMFSEYWFLPVLYIANIFMNIMYVRLQEPKKMFGISLVIAGIYGICITNRIIPTPMGMGEALLALPFLCAGFCTCKDTDKYAKWWNTVSVIILMGFVHLYMYKFNVGIISMYNSDIINVVLFYLVGFGSIYVLVVFAKNMKWCINKNLFSYLGRNTLWIYGIHYIILDVIVGIHFKYIEEQNIIVLRLLALGYAIITVVICRRVIHIKNEK